MCPRVFGTFDYLIFLCDVSHCVVFLNWGLFLFVVCLITMLSIAVFIWVIDPSLHFQNLCLVHLQILNFLTQLSSMLLNFPFRLLTNLSTLITSLSISPQLFLWLCSSEVHIWSQMSFHSRTRHSYSGVQLSACPRCPLLSSELEEVSHWGRKWKKGPHPKRERKRKDTGCSYEGWRKCYGLEKRLDVYRTVVKVLTAYKLKHDRTKYKFVNNKINLKFKKIKTHCLLGMLQLFTHAQQQ